MRGVVRLRVHMKTPRLGYIKALVHMLSPSSRVRRKVSDAGSFRCVVVGKKRKKERPQARAQRTVDAGAFGRSVLGCRGSAARSPAHTAQISSEHVHQRQIISAHAASYWRTPRAEAGEWPWLPGLAAPGPATVPVDVPATDRDSELRGEPAAPIYRLPGRPIDERAKGGGGTRRSS